jgi:toxin YoeB
MIYKVIISDEAEFDILRLRKSGNKVAIKKIDKFLDEIEIHPYTGTGKPEPLKDNMSGFWSRRISDKHRFIYKVNDNKVVVIVVSSYGHYDDK